MTAQIAESPSSDSRTTLIDALNDGLAYEYAAVVQYQTYSSQVQGPWRQDLREFFASEVPDELGHAQILADKIVALDGQPVMEPAETKWTTDPKQMLANSLADEKATIERYVKLRALAEEAGEYGLAVDLDDLIADETRHRDDIQLILNDWD